MEKVKHTPDIVGFKSGAENFPLMTVLTVSMDCSGKCPRCPYVNNQKIVDKYKYSQFMPPFIFRKIANEVGKHNAWLRLSGREPLLHPEMIDLIEHAKWMGCKVALNTNGANLSRGKVDRLLNCNIDAVLVSVDASDRETYAKVRPGLSFDRLFTNIRYLKLQRDLRKSATSIIASVVNQIEVKDKIHDIVLYWKPWVDKVMVRKYLTWGFLDQSKSGDPTPYMDDNTSCPFIYERLNIDTMGVVSACGYDIGFDHPIGNVVTDSIENIWRGAEFESMRWKMSRIDWANLPMCKDCTDRKYRSWDYNFYKVVKDANNRQS